MSDTWFEEMKSHILENIESQKVSKRHKLMVAKIVLPDFYYLSALNDFAKRHGAYLEGFEETKGNFRILTVVEHPSEESPSVSPSVNIPVNVKDYFNSQRVEVAKRVGKALLKTIVDKRK